MFIFAPISLVDILPITAPAPVSLDTIIKSSNQLSDLGFVGGFIAAVLVLTYVGVELIRHFAGKKSEPQRYPTKEELAKIVKEGCPSEELVKIMKGEIQQFRNQIPPHIIEAHHQMMESIKSGVEKMGTTMNEVNKTVNRTDDNGVPKVYAGGRILAEMTETNKEIRDAIQAGNREHSRILSEMVITLKQMAADSNADHRALAEALGRVEAKS